MKEKIIFVFPGQGAQYIGMAKDIFKEFAVVRYTFDEIESITGCNIAEMCFNGPAHKLSTAANTSLATFAHSIAIARIIETEFAMPLYKIAYAMSGHSMGQYSALYCIDSMKIKDAINVLAARSTYMSMTNKDGGGMGAIVGLDQGGLEKVLLASVGHGYVEIANHNARDQFIISGQNEALDAVLAAARHNGARVAKRLNISVPAHCALMSGAEKLLRKHLEEIEIIPPKTNWFSNQTGNVMSNPMDIKDALADQMTHGVRWAEIMEKFPSYNITCAYELGPGRTLTGLINRANVGCTCSNTDNFSNVKNMLNELSVALARTL